VLAAGTYLAARTLGTWELYLIACALPALVLIAWLLVLSAGRRLTATRSVWPVQPSAGDHVRVTVEVANTSFAPGPQITAKGVRGDLEADVDELQLESLPPRSTRKATAEVSSARRGVYSLPPLRLESDDPLGLVRTVTITGARTSLTVYPRLPHLDSCPLLGHLEGGRLPSGNGRTALGGSELRGVRPHCPGEPLNHVDWKATARTGALMLRELEDPAVGDVSVVIDGTAGAARGHVDEGFERAVQAGGSLADYALRAGRTVELAVHESAWRELTLSPGPDSGRRLRELLAAAAPTATVPLATQLRQAAADDRAGTPTRTWVFVLRLLDRALVRSLAALRRRGSPVCALLIDETPIDGSRATTSMPGADLVLALSAADVPCLVIGPGDDLETILSPAATPRVRALSS